MWLIFCIIILYLSIGVGFITKLDRGDFDLDPYEMEQLNLKSDKGYFSKKLKEDFIEAVNTIIIFVALWPIALFFIKRDLKEEREKYLGENAVNR